ncbi:MAG: hypothetical protein IT437_02040 [Phycisphaerales bacterium]|nr:hypothetical protein [Phycisphaerales bacterium]
MSRRTIFAAAVSLAFCAGCVHTENDNIAIGGRVGLPAIVGQAEPAPAWPEGASVVGIDRSNWGRTTIEVPVNGVGHGPLYYQTRQWTEAVRRQRGQYPTPESSLDLVEGSTGWQRTEALAAPFISIGQIVAMVPKMFFAPPWSDHFSPREAYDRYWHPQGPEAPTPKGGG